MIWNWTSARVPELFYKSPLSIRIIGFSDVCPIENTAMATRTRQAGSLVHKHYMVTNQSYTLRVQTHLFRLGNIRSLQLRMKSTVPITAARLVHRGDNCVELEEEKSLRPEFRHSEDPFGVTKSPNSP